MQTTVALEFVVILVVHALPYQLETTKYYVTSDFFGLKFDFDHIT